jgi:hypothetical protein
MSQSQQTTATTQKKSSFDPQLNWVVSYPKSGNTWIRLVARCYSTGRPELSALGRAGDMAVAPHHNASPIPLHQLGLPGEVQVRYAAMLDLAGQVQGKGHLLKSHHAFCEIGGVHLWSPRWVRKVVYVVRDPREVCCSAANHFGLDLEESAEFLGQSGNVIGGERRPLHHVIGSWSEHVRSWRDAQEDVDVYMTRYEDLHDDPYGEFGRILEHVLGEVEQERLEAAVDACEFDRLQSLEEDEDVGDFPEASQQAEQGFFRSGQTDGWKDELPSDLAEKIENDHGKIMSKFGYL